MRALVVSDIHSNLEAFQAVLDDAARRGGFDEIWNLGDLVGYGPDPGRCIELLRRHSHVGVVGNHDLVAAGALSPDDFNYNARVAALWTATQVNRDESQFLRSLPEVVARGECTMVHGSLRSPVMEYLLSPESAMGTFALMESRICLVGHSHIPFICQEGAGTCTFNEFPEDRPVPLVGARFIVNPGGVGQPRDHDPRPSYAIFDSVTSTIERHRVVYDMVATQEKMRRAGLPEALILRLDHGV